MSGEGRFDKTKRGNTAKKQEWNSMLYVVYGCKMHIQLHFSAAVGDWSKSLCQLTCNNYFVAMDRLITRYEKRNCFFFLLKMDFFFHKILVCFKFISLLQKVDPFHFSFAICASFATKAKMKKIKLFFRVTTEEFSLKDFFRKKRKTFLLFSNSSSN